MNQKLNIFRGVTTVEYLLVVAFLTTIMVGVAAFFRPMPSENVTPINSSLAMPGDTRLADTEFEPATNNGAETPVGSNWSLTNVIGWQLLFAAGLAICIALIANISRSRNREDTQSAKRVQQDELKPTRHIMLEKRTALRSILSRNWNTVLKSELPVSDIMSGSVVSVSMNESVKSLHETMSEKQIHHVLVIDEMENLVGIISDRDLRGASDRARCARDIMTPDPIAVMPHTDVKQAISMILRHRFSALPVVNSRRKVCGILTSSDLLATLQCTLGLLFEVSSLLHKDNCAQIVKRELGSEMAMGLASDTGEQSISSVIAESTAL